MRKRKFTEKEALEIVFEKIKPTTLPMADYEKFRSYRRRYQKGELKRNAIINLLEYFGYLAEIKYIYDKTQDQSKK